jgi:hypothetical protein
MCKRCKTHKDNKGLQKRTGSLLLNWHLLLPSLHYHGRPIGELHPMAAPATCTARGPKWGGEKEEEVEGISQTCSPGWRGDGKAAVGGKQRRPHAVVVLQRLIGDEESLRRCSASTWSSWRPRLGPADDGAANPWRWCTGRRRWRPHGRRCGTRRQNGAGQGEAREEARPHGYIGARCAPLAWRACQGRRAGGGSLAREALAAGPRWALAGLGRGGAGWVGGLGLKQVDRFSFFLKSFPVQKQLH